MRTATQRALRAHRYGRWAERATLWLFWFRGWSLVAWRLRLGRFELDLLLSRGAELRLLEVKARRAGAWVGADTALTYAQRVRLQKAWAHWLDHVPWPGSLTFQRVSWAGMRVRFHAIERWDSLRPLRPTP